MYVRKPVFAGSFYPGNADNLRNNISDYINSASVKTEETVFGIITPHAGYVYSGPVAGYSYKQLIGKKIDTAIILAPSHRAYFDGASVIPEGIYRTPLGDSEIDSSIAKELLSEKGFAFAEELEKVEHSLEVQVPFLQYVQPGAKIVPVIIGTHNINVLFSIADILYKYIAEKNSVVIISTDLSHFHSYSKAMEIDRRFIISLLHCDEEKLSDNLRSGESEACGEAALVSGIRLAKKMGAKKIVELKYMNSGDTAGDKNKVVGYVSAAMV